MPLSVASTDRLGVTRAARPMDEIEKLAIPLGKPLQYRDPRPELVHLAAEADDCFCELNSRKPRLVGPDQLKGAGNEGVGRRINCSFRRDAVPATPLFFRKADPHQLGPGIPWLRGPLRADKDSMCHGLLLCRPTSEARRTKRHGPAGGTMHHRASQVHAAARRIARSVGHRSASTKSRHTASIAHGGYFFNATVTNAEASSSAVTS